VVCAIQFKIWAKLSCPLAYNIVKNIKASVCGSLAGFQKWLAFQTCSRNIKFKQKRTFLTLCPFTVIKEFIPINSHIDPDSDLIVPLFNFSRSKVVLLKTSNNTNSYFTKAKAISVAISLHKSKRKGGFFAIAR